MNNNIETAELEQMRAELSILKQKLNEQTIVNDKLIRKTMAQRLSWVGKYVIAEVISIPFIIAVVVAAFHFFMGISWPTCVAWSVLLVMSVASDVVINNMRGLNFMDGNLTDVAEKLALMNRRRWRYEMVGIALLVMLTVWTIVEALHAGVLPDDMVIAGCTGFVVGGVVGGCIGVRILRKMMRLNDQIIAEIENMRKE